MRPPSTFLTFFLIAFVAIIPFASQAQDSEPDSLTKSDKLLKTGHFVYQKSLFSRDLFAPPDNVPAGTTITLSDNDQRIKTEVILLYSGDRFVRRATDERTGSIMEESFDGTYFCRLNVPPALDTSTNPHLIIERKGTLLNEVTYPDARAFTIYPGAMLFQGRGLTQIKPGIEIKDEAASFPFANLIAKVTFDSVHDDVANSFRLLRNGKEVVTEMVMTKPVRLTSGVWIASESIHRVFDGTGKVDTETKVNLVAEKPFDASQSFAPEILQGYVISFIVNGQEVVFRKTTPNPITLSALEELATKKAPQDAARARQIIQKEAKDAQIVRTKQIMRVVYGVLALGVAALIFAIARFLIKSR